MPGIFGVVGGSSQTRRALEQAYSKRWPNTTVERAEGSIVGGHAFTGAAAIHVLDDGRIVALDGEWSLYREVSSKLARRVAHSETIPANGFERDVVSTGNVALMDPHARTVHLSVDPSGAFPLYYIERDGTLLFSSLLRPLGAATDAARDDLAVLEFLRQAYTVGSKTPYKGVMRLLPGQALTYRSGSPVQAHEQSTAWVGPSELDTDAAAEETWARLGAALRRGIPQSGSALMMSGGWDSRTLLAGAKASERELVGYSHGDTESRELRIVRQLCRTTSTPCHMESIDNRVLDFEMLRYGFDRTGNVVFPHWHRAGAILAGQGVEVISAGIFGEILGGHYGPGMLAGTAGKMGSVVSTFLGLGNVYAPGARASATDYLRVPHFGRHWYLNEEYEASIDAPRERMNAAIESAVTRLQRRGVEAPVALVEGFISEHRGTQYINAQLLSCRAYTDIALPFAGREMFSFSTCVPLDAKLHNKLNRTLLARYAPELLRPPLAATLVPAGCPVLIQEASRLLRKLYEAGGMVSNSWTDGKIRRPRLGWVNFDFLREGRALHHLAERLSLPIWNRPAIHHHIDLVAGQTDLRRLHPFFDQFSKILSTDLLLR